MNARRHWISGGFVVAGVCTASLLSQSLESNTLADLLDGVGTYSRPMTTTSSEAQKFFDQGLRLTFGYYFPEAIACRTS
jgi:hypothetical protein